MCLDLILQVHIRPTQQPGAAWRKALEDGGGGWVRGGGGIHTLSNHKNSWFYNENNNFVLASHVLVHFFEIHHMTIMCLTLSAVSLARKCGGCKHHQAFM